MTDCKICVHNDVCERWCYQEGQDASCYSTDESGCSYFREANKWIPVTERLPEKDGKYLVHRIICNRIPIMSVVGFARNGKKVHEFDLRKHKNVWHDYDSETGYYPLTTVTHWMPLPNPPKEVDNA